MREDLLKEVFLDLQEQQRQNEEEEQRRRRRVQEEFPTIGEMIRSRENLIQDTMRDILRGVAAPEDLPARMEKVSGDIRKALEENNLPADYLSPVYSCPLCQDTGFVGDDVREKCSCVQTRYQAKLRKAIGLPEDNRETFEKFNPMVFPDKKDPGERYSQREAMNKIRKVCEDWANRYPNQEHRDLILSGKSGLGKTFLLHAMASRLIERGYNVLVISAYRFLEIARKSYFENDGSQLEELIGTEILMLDDLGSEPQMQNITVEQLFNLINERQRRDLATVISTNLNVDEMKRRYTERIVSRLSDNRNGLFIPLEGRDIRTGIV